MAEPEWILERERRQMEQILELDLEELQVEEVDDAGSSSSSSDVDTFLRNNHGDGGSNTSEELTINTSLPSLCTYVGCTGFDDTQRRFTFLDGGAVLSLPMFYLQGVVLFPEATLPLRVMHPRSLAAVDKAINHVDAPCMIGVVHVYDHINDGQHVFASTGTTAEIQQIKQLDDGSSTVITRGQQRFRLRRRWIDVDGLPWGEVQIIEEDKPLRTPRDAFGQLAASCTFKQFDSSVLSLGVSSFKQYDHVDSELDWDSLSPTSTSSDHSVTDTGLYCSSNEDEDVMCEPSCQKHDSAKQIGALGHQVKNTDIESLSKVKKKNAEQQRWYHGTCNSRQALQAPLSFWPRWAYEMYDSYSLARRAADLWRQIIVNPSMDDHVRKPDILSFHIGSKLPMSGSVRQELLEIDGISYRLQREIQLLKTFNLIRCRNCLSVIARRCDMVVMSSAYGKPYDCAPQMITVYNATGLGLRGKPSKAHSWFPGYTWTIVLCATCESNIGWHFRADKKNPLPKSFWGVRSSQVSDETHSILD